MAATEQGVWDLQDVRDKQLASQWNYDGALGKWFSWGRNNYGNVGDNSRTERSSPVQVPGTTWATGANGLGGEISSHGVKTDGTMWGWGWNQQGFVGDNSLTNRSSPVQLPGTTWAYVTEGTDQVLATKTDGTLWTWGQNSYGQLCTGDETGRSSPTQIPGTSWAVGRKKISSTGRSMVAIRSDGTGWSWGGNYAGRGGTDQGPGGANQYFTSPRQIAGTNWSLFEAGMHSVMAIKTDGTLWGWGYNSYGNLGLNFVGNDGSPAYHGVSSPVQVGSDSTWKDIALTHENDGGYCAIKTDGTLWGWGRDRNGSMMINDYDAKRSSPTQVGTDTDWDQIEGIGAGGVSVLKTNGTLWVAGWGGYGGLGDNTGPSISRSSPTQVPGTWKLPIRGSSKDSPFRTVLKPV